MTEDAVLSSRWVRSWHSLWSLWWHSRSSPRMGAIEHQRLAIRKCVSLTRRTWRQLTGLPGQSSRSRASQCVRRGWHTVRAAGCDELIPVLCEVAGEQRTHWHDGDSLADAFGERLTDQKPRESASSVLCIHLCVEENALTVCLWRVDEVCPPDWLRIAEAHGVRVDRVTG